ncbi:MAG: dicarboxylate/amino acid:cation symporter [Holosporaceae bacterium]|jgi:Na+/H+-dicarboxylate symporter|nr:dicarboxylate/amino acid:cation symporter [Holosporaceae bacterium]
MKKFAMPVIFLLALLSAMFWENLLSSTTESFFYAVSLAIKECIIFALPFIIFSLIHLSMSKIGADSLKLLVIVVPLICCSNFINTIISYLLGCLCIKADLASSVHEITRQNTSFLTPLFSFSLAKIVSNDLALLIGAISGILCGLIKKRKKNMQFIEMHDNWLNKLELFINIFFEILVPLMILFIFGTALKLKHDGIILSLLSEYFAITVIFIISAYGYVFLQLFIGSDFKFSKWLYYLKNLLPAIVTGFGSMSSAAALPLSIQAAEANCEDKNNAAIIVPCSVNVHLVGDCFFIPFIALVILFSFGHGLPDFPTYLIFALYFVIAKFAVAAVPGGGILVMLPILEKHLGFNADMLGLITAIYIMFDSFITGCNVAGNGSFAILFDKIARAATIFPSGESRNSEK